MHYMLVNLLHSHYIQHVMYVITYPLHAFKDANVEPSRAPPPALGDRDGVWLASSPHDTLAASQDKLQRTLCGQGAHPMSPRAAQASHRGAPPAQVPDFDPARRSSPGSACERRRSHD